MEKSILFITTNQDKLREVREILGSSYNVLSLKEINWTEEIEEPFETIAENSVHKAKYFFEKTGRTCIAEDSGLEVDALNGKPGALSARYAGEDKNHAKNIEKVLLEMKGIENRSARFKSVFTYQSSEICISFEGTMEGNINESVSGTNGFGYDPIFIPNGLQKTNAELSAQEKNQISHRKKALSKLIRYLQE